MLAGCGRLDRCLGRICEQATSQPQENLRTDETGLRLCRRAAGKLDEEGECDHEDAGAGDDDVFEPANHEDHQPDDDATDDAEKGEERLDAGGTVDGEVKGNHQDSV